MGPALDGLEVLRMDEAAIRKRLAELHETMKSSAFLGLKSSVGQGLYVPSDPAADGSINESFSAIRLQLKYLMFDLEATRRENRYLRQMLDSRARREREDPEEI